MTTQPTTILPPAYKKRMFQGVAAWLLVAACVGGWVKMHAADSVKDWNARIPQASAPVKPVYLTPQITDTAHPDFNAPVGDATAPPAGSAAIALIMTDMGLSDEETKRAIDDLPPQVALAVSPYGNMQKWIKKATGAGHEALVLLPMEPDTYPKDDPGPRALLTRTSAADNAHNLETILQDADGAYGIMNFMGSAVLADKPNMSAIYDTLKKSGLTFVENRGAKPTDAAELAGEDSVPYLATDIKIDTVATETDVAEQLLDLEKLARRQGYAIGIAEPYPVSFNVIKSWAEGLEKRGLRLVPLSAVWKAKSGARAPQAAPAEQQAKDVPAAKK